MPGYPLLFTENETNQELLFAEPNESPYVKDGINSYVVQGKQDAVNPAKVGTKVSPPLPADGGGWRNCHHQSASDQK